MIAFIGPLLTAVLCTTGDSYLDEAVKVGHWLDSVAIQTDHGTSWPVVPGEQTTSSNLYSGSPGVILFYLELYRASRDSHWLEMASKGSDALAAELRQPAEQGNGLYVGPAGAGYALHEVFLQTGKQQHLQAARHCLAWIHDHARGVGDGVQWSEVTDLVSGNAGQGLFLLYAAQSMQDADSLSLARGTGQRLLEVAERTEHGWRWKMRPDDPRYLPNFSHGTSGVCYFLATLYLLTQDGAFLDGATEGTRFLDHLAMRTGDKGLVYHHEPEGEKLFYLGWCHGPPGTSRLYYRLWQITGNKSWTRRIRASSEALRASGIPEQRPEGFWNNLGICCGSAGVAAHLLEMQRRFRLDPKLEFSRRLTSDLLQRSTEDRQGLRWTHAEHRVRPDFLQAQTGYMQGAAGIGLWLLQLDAALNGRSFQTHLPDSPYHPTRL